ERSEVRRVGSERATRVDVRVIAATRRDLDREVQDGRFRDDLYHRLAVARVELPPLRRRRGDVAVLARRFYAELGADPASLAHELLRRWERYGWPGNVRQLRNTVARQIALGDLSESDLAPESAVDPSKLAAKGRDFLEAIIAQQLPLPLARLRVVQEFE